MEARGSEEMQSLQNVPEVEKLLVPATPSPMLKDQQLRTFKAYYTWYSTESTVNAIE